MKNCIILILLIAVSLCAACARNTGLGERRLSAIRGVPPQLETQELTISRAKLNEALTGEGATNRIRLVQIYPSAAAVPQFVAPEYRLFDVNQKSVYYLLGLRTMDVLVGVNDRVLVDPALFHEFIRMLPAVAEATIEIRRNEKPILFKYKFE